MKYLGRLPGEVEFADGELPLFIASCRAIDEIEQKRWEILPEMLVSMFGK